MPLLKVKPKGEQEMMERYFNSYFNTVPHCSRDWWCFFLKRRHLQEPQRKNKSHVSAMQRFIFPLIFSSTQQIRVTFGVFDLHTLNACHLWIFYCCVIYACEHYDF